MLPLPLHSPRVCYLLIPTKIFGVGWGGSRWYLSYAVGYSVITTLLGAATAYFITANQLLRQTHFYIQPEAMSDTTAMYVNTLLYMCFMYPVACIK